MYRTIARLRAPITTSGMITHVTAGAVFLLAGLTPDLLTATFSTKLLVDTVCGAGLVAILGKTIMSWPRGDMGIVLDLWPEDGKRDWGHLGDVALRQAKREHGRSVLIRKHLSVDPRQRAKQLAGVKQKLNRATGDEGRPVTVYVNATLHDSFALGRLFRTGSLPLILMQRSGSTFYPSVELGDHLRTGLTEDEKERACQLFEVDPRPLAPDARKLALLVVLSSRSGEVTPRMLEAARTGRSDEYVMGPADRCRAALTVHARSGSVEASREGFEFTIRHIYEQWTSWPESQQETGEQLVFINSPATIAMALGWVFGPKSWRLIAHDPSTNPTRPAKVGS